MKFVYGGRVATGAVPCRPRLHRRPFRFRPNHLRRDVAVGGPGLVDESTTVAALTIDGGVVDGTSGRGRRVHAGGRDTGRFRGWVDLGQHLHVVEDLQGAAERCSVRFGRRTERRGCGTGWW